MKNAFELELSLSFLGQSAAGNQIDFYDAAQALVGFQRSLALTTHLILNNEIITQAPSLAGATIIALPSEEGSWKQRAVVVGTWAMIAGGAYKLGTAPTDTPLGHLVSSAYDYVISETLGFHVDYDQTLGQQIESVQQNLAADKKLTQNRFDSVIEKCETAIESMHRPIVASNSAERAIISRKTGGKEKAFKFELSEASFEHVKYSRERPKKHRFVGSISSYNINTFKGRIYIEELGRPVPFELDSSAKSPKQIQTIVSSLSRNSSFRTKTNALIEIEAVVIESRTGRIKKLYVQMVTD
ncbi:hypothetical protein [Maricaulis parjimensis]|uniref:DUF7946 domain-containing protein n=1 Tax=Maricaulis parjimensis TaxID=144023 RepID=UPI0019398E3C|nr:hypothetical protein [Maricaulis parjimensis]